MVIRNFNSFRRYTPPTCTLEIYHPQPFWGRWRAQSFPPLFSFQLHFDDPRLAKEERMSIIGDRDLLEKLRIKVEKYVHKYLNSKTIWDEELSSEICVKKEEDEAIYLSRQSAYSHLLYYQSFEPHQEVIEVILSNTQLVDLVNALEAYYWDATTVKIKPKKQPVSMGTAVALTSIVVTVGGFMGWRYQTNRSINVAEKIPDSSVEDYSQNITAVIPPSPLDLETVPKIVSPTIPKDLLNQKPLLPPEPTLTQPPTNLLITANVKQNRPKDTTDISSATKPINSQSAISSTEDDQMNSSLITGIQTSYPSDSESSQLSKQLNNQFLSLPVLSSNDANQNSLAKASLSAINNLSNVPNVASINKASQSNLEEKFNSSSSSVISKTIRQDISGEVKQYFKDRWQPPENLNQSIEYRLELEENGSLTKIVPVGQVAAVFREQTPLPLIGEVITSSFTKISPLTVRLILTPNGGVQTFAE